jgi:hypothetical protein
VWEGEEEDDGCMSCALGGVVGSSSSSGGCCLGNVLIGLIRSFASVPLGRAREKGGTFALASSAFITSICRLQCLSGSVSKIINTSFNVLAFLLPYDAFTSTSLRPLSVNYKLMPPTQTQEASN